MNTRFDIFGNKTYTKTSPTCDTISRDLDKLLKMTDAMNKHLSKMINDIQKDWSDDEKMMVNNPKEYYSKTKQTNNQMAKELSIEALEWLKGCSIDGMVVKLPENGYNKAVYQEVKVRLEGIGGHWKGGKVAGFVFTHDPTELLVEVAQGVKRNLKKEFQFFATPAKLCDRVVAMADIKPFRTICEPSCGQGAFIKAIHRIIDGAVVYCYEIMPQNKEVLFKNIDERFIVWEGDDFLKADKNRRYDYIIANPPFSNNQDIDHIRAMHHHLADKGTLVSIASRHWQNSSNKKETDFRTWLARVGGVIEDIAAGEFKESGTNIATCIIKICK